MPTKRKKFTQLSLADRKSIEKEVRKKEPKLRKLAKELKCSPSTISAEVKRNRTYARGKYKGKFTSEVSETPNYCRQLTNWPFVCSGCRYRFGCKCQNKLDYIASRAQLQSDFLRSVSRQGVRIDQETFHDILDCIIDDLAKCLSPTLIAAHIKETLNINISSSTIYNWIHKGYGHTGILHLPLASRYRPRKKKKTQQSAITDKTRLMEAFRKLSLDEQVKAPQLDTVEGRQSDTRYILSIHFVREHFQLFIKLEGKDAKEVAKGLDCVETCLGQRQFKQHFKNSLVDRGPEFRNLELIEASVFNKNISRMFSFYTDPCTPSQKGACERNHRELRSVLPKATDHRSARSFNILTQADCNKLTSHVNSKPRKSLNGKTPIEVFKYIYPDTFALLQKQFHIEEISLSELNLSPSLIQNGRWE